MSDKENNQNTTLQVNCYWSNIPINYSLQIINIDGTTIEMTICTKASSTYILSIQTKTDVFVLLSPLSEEYVQNKLFLTIFPHKNHVINYFLNKKIKNQVDIFYKNFTVTEKEDQITIMINKILYHFKHNYIDNNISVFTICNINLSKTKFITPNVPFQLAQENFSIKHLKFCIKILFGRDGKQSPDITIHEKTIPIHKVFTKKEKEEILNIKIKEYEEEQTFIRNNNNHTCNLLFFSELSKIIHKIKDEDNYYSLSYKNLPQDKYDIILHEIQSYQYLLRCSLDLYNEKVYNNNAPLNESDFFKLQTKVIFILNQFDIKKNKLRQELSPTAELQIYTYSLVLKHFLYSNQLCFIEPKFIDYSLIDNKNNFYLQSFTLLKEIINSLTSNSSLTDCLSQLNSEISIDLNLMHESCFENQIELSIIPLSQLKKDLLSIIPSYFVREFIDDNNYAHLELYTGIPIINECVTFDMLQDEIDYRYNEGNDDKKMFAFPILINLFHELFGHQKWRHNKDNINEYSPLCFIKNGKEGILTKDENLLEESGRIVETFLCDGNYEVLRLLSHPTENLSNLFNSYYFIQKDFSELVEEVNKIIRKNKREHHYITHFESIVFTYKTDVNIKKIMYSNNKEKETFIHRKTKNKEYNSCIDRYFPK